MYVCAYVYVVMHHVGEPLVRWWTVAERKVSFDFSRCLLVGKRAWGGCVGGAAWVGEAVCTGGERFHFTACVRPRVCVR